MSYHSNLVAPTRFKGFPNSGNERKLNLRNMSTLSPIIRIAKKSLPWSKPCILERFDQRMKVSVIEELVRNDKEKGKPAKILKGFSQRLRQWCWWKESIFKPYSESSAMIRYRWKLMNKNTEMRIAHHISATIIKRLRMDDTGQMCARNEDIWRV